MLRFHGRMSLAAALVAAGLANAEPPAAKPAESDNVMTLTSENGKPRKYLILKTSKHPSGGFAYEVKAQDNGEILTVIENSPSEKVSATLPAPTITEGNPKPIASDPILKPKDYIASPKVEKQLGVEPVKPKKTVVNYDKAPKPVMNRLFGPKKESKPAMRSKPLPPAPPAVEAVRHADPVIRMIGGLRDETLPSLREFAAESLATGPGRHRSEVVDALIAAAQHDPAPGVRVCCARCLADMDVRSPACIVALNSMKSDDDETVRSAAAAALARVKP